MIPEPISATSLPSAVTTRTSRRHHTPSNRTKLPFLPSSFNKLDDSTRAALVSMNNGGIAYLKIKQYKKALSFLDAGLAVLINHNVESDIFRLVTRAKRKSHRDASTLESRNDQAQPQQDNTNNNNNTIASHFIYENPIRLGQTNSKSWIRPRDEEYATVIVYNMALCYHLYAFNGTAGNESPCPKKLYRALYLYEAVHSIETQTCNDTDDIAMTMALANNCGHILMTLDKRTKADRYFKHLLQTILCMTSGGQELEPMRDAMDGFVDNVSHLILKSGPTAPAA